MPKNHRGVPIAGPHANTYVEVEGWAEAEKYNPRGFNPEDHDFKNTVPSRQDEVEAMNDSPDDHPFSKVSRARRAQKKVDTGQYSNRDDGPEYDGPRTSDY